MIDVPLHPKQLRVMKDTHKRLVLGWGRRSGKSYVAAWWSVTRLLTSFEDTTKRYGATAKVLIVSNTLGQVKDLYYALISEVLDACGLESGVDYIANKQDLEYTVKRNGKTRMLKLAGIDNHKSLLGSSIIALVMDECQEMTDLEIIWDKTLRPACGDLEAPALFCGTPDITAPAKWRELWEMGLSKDHPTWHSIGAISTDNTFIDMALAIDEARHDGMSENLIQMEFFARFDLDIGSTINVSNVPRWSMLPDKINTFITIDTSHYTSLDGLSVSNINKLDENAICIASVCNHNLWYIREIVHGRWDVQETAKIICDLFKVYKPDGLGIEKGAGFNALMPWLDVEFAKINEIPDITPLSPKGADKTTRIVTRLQGRYERNMILYPSSNPPWIKVLDKQIKAFPSRNVHDDLPDAESYIDEMVGLYYEMNEPEHVNTKIFNDDGTLIGGNRSTEDIMNTQHHNTRRGGSLIMDLIG